MLTTEQIQNLDCYFEENGIEFYDLRQELVDHVSQTIENKMKTEGISFEVAYEEAIKVFDKKTLQLQNLEARLEYSPLREWRYLNAKRSLVALGSCFLMILPMLFVSTDALFYLQVFYAVAGLLFYIQHLYVFLNTAKIPAKKLRAFQPLTNFEWGFPLLFFSFSFGWFLFSHEKIVKPDTAIGVHVLYVVLLVFSISALMAQLHVKKQQYNLAKKIFPFLFKN